MILEIRTYRLKPGTRDVLLGLMRDRAVPLLARFAIQVVALGSSLVDEEQWEEAYLMRAFPSLAERDRQEDAFYGSRDWRDDLRDRVLACIESYHTVVLDVPDIVVAGLTRPVAAA